MNPDKIYRVAAASPGRDLPWLTDFSFPWKKVAPPATRFRAFHCNDIFHFEFEAEDGDIVLDESENDHDKVLGSDRVELFFSPTPDLTAPYYGLEMDPR